MMWFIILAAGAAGLLAGYWLGYEAWRAPEEPPPLPSSRSMVARSKAEREAERIIEHLL